MPCRSSHEERGLKLSNKFFILILKCRSSHEERGLKYRANNVVHLYQVSLLSRGAWIEIGTATALTTGNIVAPLTRSVD